MRQLLVGQQDLPSTSFKNLCIYGTYQKYFVYPLDFLSTSGNFLCSFGPSGNSQCGHGTFPPVASTFRAAVVPSANFRAVVESSVNSQCGRGILRKLLSLFCAAEGPSINVR